LISVGGAPADAPGGGVVRRSPGDERHPPAPRGGGWRRGRPSGVRERLGG
jgi:hypothetical protein